MDSKNIDGSRPRRTFIVTVVGDQPLDGTLGPALPDAPALMRIVGRGLADSYPDLAEFGVIEADAR